MDTQSFLWQLMNQDHANHIVIHSKPRNASGNTTSRVPSQLDACWFTFIVLLSIGRYRYDVHRRFSKKNHAVLSWLVLYPNRLYSTFQIGYVIELNNAINLSNKEQHYINLVVR